MVSRKSKTPPTKQPKKTVSADPPIDPGNSLLRYFIPIVLASAIILGLLTTLGQQLIRSEQRSVVEMGARQAAQALAARFAATIEGAREQLRLLAADPRIVAALRADPQVRAKLANKIGHTASDFLQLRIIPAGLSSPDPTGPAPLGFAGVDLIRRVQAGQEAAAEVHQLNSSTPYLALAEPIGGNSIGDTGALFGAISIAPMIKSLSNLSLPSTILALVQESEGTLVSLDPNSPGPSQHDGTVDVAGSILKVAFQGQLTSGVDLGLLTHLGLAVFGVLAVTLVAWMQSRRLGADLRADMGVAVTLGEALLRGEPGPRPQPKVQSVGETLMLLAQYAQQKARSGAGGPKVVPGAAKVQPNTSDVSPSDEPVLGSSTMVVDELEEVPSRLGAPSDQNVLDSAVFRAYDIRGRADDDFSPAKVESLGAALGTEVGERGGTSVAVGRDVRLSSPELAQALVKGLTSSGCTVTDLGEIPTPVVYFARYELGVDCGVMVTGSHNPPEYNGFKITIGDEMLAGEELAGLRQMILDNRMVSGSGSVQQRDLGRDYVTRVTDDVALGRPFRVVIDAGNGVAGPLAVDLLTALGCDVVPLNCEPDGRFPNHPPDPSQPENVVEVARSVTEQGADLGMALDGDGDRLLLIDQEGKLVSPDRLFMLLASDILIRHPGADVLYDVKSSRHLAGFILGRGGRPIMWQSGHARMKAKMRETGALLAGEFTGQYYIKERWYGFDDGLYAAARILEILSADPRPCGEVFAEFPSTPATPELLLPLQEGQNIELMRGLAETLDFPDAKVIDIDGLRVEFGDGWGLVRPSNTASALMFRFEGNDQDALVRVQTLFRDWVEKVQPGLQLPF